MRLFSQRKGITSIKKKIQIDDMDQDLRNSLWNALDLIYWSIRERVSYIYKDESLSVFLDKLWVNFFKLPRDEITDFWNDTLKIIKDYYFNFSWYEVYDFLEFTANNYPDIVLRRNFLKLCNEYLEREVSGYRFVGNLITQITSDVEISEIEEALHSPLKTVQDHIQQALTLYSDRKTPDYRNSIKEAISAVEAISKVIVADNRTTLGRALESLEQSAGVELHASLKDAFKKLYGYTSDAEGIRHALMDEPNLSAEDAKFMLIACSAFVNFLAEKAGKAGIEL